DRRTPGDRRAPGLRRHAAQNYDVACTARSSVTHREAKSVPGNARITAVTPHDFRPGFTATLGQMCHPRPHSFLALALLACSFLASADSGARLITGVVSDSTGASIAGAAVQFRGESSAQTKTDSAGRFELRVSGSSGTLTASASGFTV